MNRLFGMMRYNKQLLVVFIVSLIEISFVLGIVVFDIVQLVVTNNNSAKLSPAFIPLNITLICVVGVTLLLIVSMLVIKLVNAKRRNLKKD